AERLRGELALATLLEEERHLRAELETLSRRLVQVRETEQRSLARELHDEVGQLLTGLHLMLEEVGSVIRPEALRLVRDLQQRIRAITLDLRPPMLDELGLVAALRWFFERYTARTCIRVAFTLKGEDRRLTHEMESGAFRIIQEALTNTARHGSVKAILVSVEFAPQRLRVSIADGGKGFDLKNARQGASTGLAGMRERARLLGGDLVIDSAPGQGTRVEVDLPLRGPVGAW